MRTRSNGFRARSEDLGTVLRRDRRKVFRIGRRSAGNSLSPPQGFTHRAGGEISRAGAAVLPTECHLNRDAQTAGIEILHDLIVRKPGGASHDIGQVHYGVIAARGL